MLIHNYPMVEAARHFGLTSSFDKCRQLAGLGPRSKAQVISQVGNRMALCTENLGFNLIRTVVAEASPEASDPMEHSSLIRMMTSLSASSSGPAGAEGAQEDEPPCKRRRAMQERPSSASDGANDDAKQMGTTRNRSRFQQEGKHKFLSG